MKQLAKINLRALMALVLFGGLTFAMPAYLQAKTKKADSTVHVTVNVHGSEVGVSAEKLEETVDKLLEAAEIDVVENGGANVLELQIDIYKEDSGFKVATDWDDDPEPEMQEECDAQDEIDEIVEKEVNAFIEFVHKG